MVLTWELRSGRWESLRRRGSVRPLAKGAQYSSSFEILQQSDHVFTQFRVCVSAFHDHRGWQFQRGNLYAGVANAFAGDMELTQGIRVENVHAGGKDEIVGGEAADHFQRFIQRGEIARVIGSLWEREVFVMAESWARPCFIGKTYVVRIFVVWVSMDGNGQDIGAFVEYVLRAVT